MEALFPNHIEKELKATLFLAWKPLGPLQMVAGLPLYSTSSSSHDLAKLLIPGEGTEWEPVIHLKRHLTCASDKGRG